MSKIADWLSVADIRKGDGGLIFPDAKEKVTFWEGVNKLVENICDEIDKAQNIKVRDTDRELD